MIRCCNAPKVGEGVEDEDLANGAAKAEDNNVAEDGAVAAEVDEAVEAVNHGEGHSQVQHRKHVDVQLKLERRHRRVLA